MPGDLKNWADSKDPKKQKTSPLEAHVKLAQLPDSETRKGKAVPFPFRDRSYYKGIYSNKDINHRIELAPVVEIPLKDLTSAQHSVKERLVSYYIDFPDAKTGSVHPKSGTPTDVPVVMQKDGIRTLWDGNHRTTAAWCRGDKAIPARFVNLDQPSPGKPESSSGSAHSKSSSSS